MARADAHLEAGRVSEAVGAYRAVLHLDPTEARAHLGLAQCSIARGQPDEAVETLVASAAQLGADGHPQTAMHLYAGALLVDPERLDVHIEVAELEMSCGHDDAATARLEALVVAYRRAGCEDEASAVEEFLGESSGDRQGVPAIVDHDPIVELPRVTATSMDDPANAEPVSTAAVAAVEPSSTEPCAGVPTRVEPTTTQPVLGVPKFIDPTVTESILHRRVERRAAVRWRPGGPGRRPATAAPTPKPRPKLAQRPVARWQPLAEPARPNTSTAPAAPERSEGRTDGPAKAAVPPSDLARRLRERGEAQQAADAGDGGKGPKTEPASAASDIAAPVDRVHRFAQTLAMITARHKPSLRLRPGKNGTVLSVRAVKPTLEEQPQAFERPDVIPPPPL